MGSEQMQSALEAMAFLVVAVAHVPVLLLMHQADGDEADRRFLMRRQAAAAPAHEKDLATPGSRSMQKVPFIVPVTPG
jgi:hypothetical protein